MILLGIPTLNRYDLLAECIESAVSGTVKPDVIEIVDNGTKLAENFEGLHQIDPTRFEMKYKDVQINVFVPGINYGVGRSWNRFLHLSDSYAIICNDDVTFEPNTIELLTNVANDVQNRHELFLAPDCYWEHHWSCFLQRKDSLAVVGEYDGNFYPGYWEDRDYKYRMKLKGYKPFIVKNCKYTHYEGGSNTIKNDSSINARFTQLGEYYRLKWGGLPESEVFTKPFNIIG